MLNQSIPSATDMHPNRAYRLVSSVAAFSPCSSGLKPEVFMAVTSIQIILPCLHLHIIRCACCIQKLSGKSRCSEVQTWQASCLLSTAHMCRQITTNDAFRSFSLQTDLLWCSSTLAQHKHDVFSTSMWLRPSCTPRDERFGLTGAGVRRHDSGAASSRHGGAV